MDPLKPAPNLDPKLKETYDRIMGNVSAGQAQTPPPSSPQTPPQPSQPRVQSILEPPPNVSPFSKPAIEPQMGFEPSMPPPPRSPLPPLPNTGQTVASPTMVSTPTTNASQAPKQGRKILTFVIILGEIVFFIIYAVVWAKIFGYF